MLVATRYSTFRSVPPSATIALVAQGGDDHRSGGAPWNTAAGRRGLEAILDRVGRQLRGRGERLTAPRRAVLTVLHHADGHLTVEEVAELVTRVDPAVHLASIYRSLDAFARLGIVQHVHLGHGSTAYHLVDDSGSHAHAQCRRCRRVWDLPADVMDHTAQRLAHEYRFVLDPTHAALSGLCGPCSAAVSRESDRGRTGGSVAKVLH